MAAMNPDIAENIPPDRSSEDVRNEVIKLFSGYTHNNKRIFTWIKRREDVCGGRNIGKFAAHPIKSKSSGAAIA